MLSTIILIVVELFLTVLTKLRRAAVSLATPNQAIVTHTQREINDSFIVEVFIWKRMLVREINIITANYKRKIPRPHHQHSFEDTILAAVQLLIQTLY